MSSGEKILSVIRADSEETIAEIKKQSEEKRQAILSKADEKAKEIAQTAQIKKAELTDRLKKSNQSRIELEKRSMVLKTKREEIEKAVRKISDSMKNLNDEAYFRLIYRLASTLGKKEGVILLNTRDLKRVPKDFLSEMAKSGITATLSNVPDDRIDSGFVLKNGDIEDNMSFDAIIAEKREAIEDVINRELFKG